jgi:cellulose synthase/poly-beta-1,6-N-acetylglucosamine synthase-like glycosyltransferase
MLTQVLALLYITGSLIHAVYQHRFTQEYYRTANDPQKKLDRSSTLPKVGIIVPVYNEGIEDLRETLNSLDRLSYPKHLIKIYLVNDGSFRKEGQVEERKNFERLLADYSERQGWTVITGHPNEGKRKAHDRAFQLAKKRCQFIYFVDSDSIPCKDIIEQFLSKMSDGVAGVCGNMGISNSNANWLTRLLNIRYLLATSVERAAESVFGHVWLIPGPASFYSTSFLEEVWDAYQNQRFKGKLCKNGDDLFLTNICNERGGLIAYAENAVVCTKVPEKLKDYLVQQARWNRDKYRDCIQTLRSAYKKGWYPLLAGVNRMLFPFLFLITSILCLTDLAGWGYLWNSAALTSMIFTRAVITYVSVRGIKGITTASALQFTVIYGAISTVLLLPVKAWSLLTRGASTWKR